MSGLKKIRLGDLLVQNGTITQAQLERALEDQRQSGRKLGRTLVELGFIQEASLLEFLSRQLQIPLINLKHYKVDIEVARLLPEAQARRFRALVLSKSGAAAVVGMADPTDLVAFDEISRILKMPLQPALAREADLLQTIDQEGGHA